MLVVPQTSRPVHVRTEIKLSPLTQRTGGIRIALFAWLACRIIIDLKFADMYGVYHNLLGKDAFVILLSAVKSYPPSHPSKIWGNHWSQTISLGWTHNNLRHFECCNSSNKTYKASMIHTHLDQTYVHLPVYLNHKSAIDMLGETFQIHIHEIFSFHSGGSLEFKFINYLQAEQFLSETFGERFTLWMCSLTHHYNQLLQVDHKQRSIRACCAPVFDTFNLIVCTTRACVSIEHAQGANDFFVCWSVSDECFWIEFSATIGSTEWCWWRTMNKSLSNC